MAVRVLLVDDSSFVRDVMRHGLSRFPDIEIVGEASDGKRAEQAVVDLRPDVVTMDVVMPMVSGLDAIRNIMRRCPTPIIVVSEAYSSREELTMDAMKAGAIDVFPKPLNGFDEKTAEKLAQLLRTAARTRPRSRRADTAPIVPPPPVSSAIRRIATRCSFAGIVSSTGGPQTLHRMLGRVNPERVPPMALVQHISDGFDVSLASWLDKCTDLHVCLARQGMQITAGTLAVAPNDFHLEIRPGGIVVLSKTAKLKSHRPSGTMLLRSIARSFGSNGVGIVLTGMGDDGAEGAAELEARGGTVLVQDPATAIIDGMPKAAIASTNSAIVDKASQLAQMLHRRRMKP